MLGNGQQSGRPGRAIANSPFLRYLEYFGSFRFLFWNILDPFGLHAQATDSLRRKVDRREIEDTLNISTLYTVSGHTHTHIHTCIDTYIYTYIYIYIFISNIYIYISYIGISDSINLVGHLSHSSRWFQQGKNSSQANMVRMVRITQQLLQQLPKRSFWMQPLKLQQRGSLGLESEWSPSWMPCSEPRETSNAHEIRESWKYKKYQKVEWC